MVIVVLYPCIPNGICAIPALYACYLQLMRHMWLICAATESVKQPLDGARAQTKY